MKQPVVYMMSNQSRKVLYVGVTSNIAKRAWEHKHGLVDGFTKQYRCHDLVFYELCDTMEAAINREKQIKKWRREKKDKLVRQMNPESKDLYNTLAFG